MDIEYDFTNDTLGNEKINKECFDKYQKKERFEKYLDYRMSSNNKKDPDNFSNKLQEIYKKKWDIIYLKTCKKDKNSVFSDTMTSVQTLISHFYIENNPEEWKKYKEKFECPNAKFPSAISMNNMISKIEDYPNFQNIFLKEEKEYKDIVDLISLYHTIGNYIPVPRDFNSCRSGPGKSAIHDMFDLTLMRIYEYFVFKEENKEEAAYNTLKDLLHLTTKNEKNENIIQSTILWLKQYETFENFVKKNYLQAYVEDDYTIKKEFTDIHSWNSPFPKDKNSYLKYFKLLKDAIKSRGKLILEN